MKFYVINKPYGHSKAEGESLKEVATTVNTNPFMIVAAESVKDGEDYQAIQVSANKVLINFKRGHRYVEASSIAEAFGDEEEQTTTKVTISYESAHGNIPNSILVDKGHLLSANELPTLDDVEDENNVYKFNGWSMNIGAIINTDTTLTAEWTTEAKVTLTYLSNYGTAPSQKKVAKSYALTSNDLPTLEYDDDENIYQFNSWKNGNDVVSVGDVINADTTLRADWTVEEV